ncbi:phenylacetate--CoA ligase family protein [Thermodesulfobacteriota bacterium]
MKQDHIFRPEIETMPWEEVRKTQVEKLRKQLAYVYERADFYKRKFQAVGFEPGDFKTIDDLSKIPFTEKKELRESQIEAPPLGTHMAADLTKVLRFHSTTGTTGRPTYIGLTARDIEVWIEVHSRLYWCGGFRPGNRVVFGYGLSMFVGGVPLIEALQNIGCSVIPVGPREGTDRFLGLSRDLGANCFTGTPSYALYLIDRIPGITKGDPKELGWKKMAVGGEPGGSVPAIRKHLEEVYQTDVRDSGCGGAEMIAGMWADCEEKNGMHFAAQEFCLPELIDPETLESIEFQDGAEGEMVYSAIDRECTPLIRYRTRDRVKVWTEKCDCGRTSVRMICFGRTDDMLIVSGVNVFPSAVKDIIGGFAPDLTGEFRIVLHEPPLGSAVNPPLQIQVEHSGELKDDELENLKSRLVNELRENLLFKAAIDLLTPGQLERSVHKSSYIHHAYKAD